MTTTAKNRLTAVKRRLQHFYGLLNEGAFARCFAMIDPRVRDNSASVTLYQYENSLRQFLTRFGPVRILEIHLDLHLDEPSKLYEGRDFAIGRTAWENSVGGQHIFSERWVREGRSWFTRSTGLIVPNLDFKAVVSADSEPLRKNS
jgi:hypothetical protein